MKFVNSLVILFLGIFAVLAVTSMWNDTANYDERIHLPAGYSYLTQKDMRLNPEHPPLVKDLTALPLLFIPPKADLRQRRMGLGRTPLAEKINFPYQSWGWNTPWTSDVDSRTPAWQTDVGFGNDLLYYSGNDAQNMMQYGRIPIILIGILLGFYLWKFSRELWGEAAAAIALAMYSFSPTILAHTRLITTDVAAAAAFFISFYYLYRWLKAPTNRNLIIFGVVLGLILLTKFSTILLIPIFGLIVLIWAILHKRLRFYITKFVFVLIISYLIVGAIYAYHIWNYSPEKQSIDTDFILKTFGVRPLADFSVWLSSQPYLRSWGHYFLGILMVLQRSTGGNTTYYLGNISSSGNYSYFPVVYLIKEPLAYIILTLFAAYLALKKFRWQNLIDSIKNYPAEFGMILIIIVYWLFSINSSLNIGVRHILPTLPFIYALTARQIGNWIKGSITERIPDYHGFWQLFGLYWKRIKRTILVSILFIWAILSVVSIYPSFLAYFNEIAGGPNGGHKWVVDSNLDWGQDILRLAQFIEKNNIKEIKMDYFSGAPAEYYIKTAKIEFYNREEPQKGWLAVSATLYMGACRNNASSCAYNDRAYTWLDSYKPVAKIGYSIFVYKIE